MEDNIIRFPLTPAAPASAAPQNDPSFERAMFFLDQELAEMTSVIPQAAPTEPRAIY